MLVDFRIKNFALIDELEINFQQGLNVLTGETGAGKSIIIGALEILLGARANSDLIRTGKENAYIEAVFEPAKIREINQYLDGVGIETEPSLILLSREIRGNGRNRNRINGQLATAGMIRQVSKYLVDIHGQHEHQLLLDTSAHLEILDEYIGPTARELKVKVVDKYQKISLLNKELAGIQIDEAEKARRIDLLEFQVTEIERANLKAGELEELYREYNVMSNIEEIFTTTGMIIDNLNSSDYSQGNSVLEKIGLFNKKLEGLAEYDSELVDYYQTIKDVYYQLEDLSYRLNDYLEGLEFNQKRLDILENRINLINGLQRKYGETIEEILEFKEKSTEELYNLKSQEKKLAELSSEIKVAKDEYQKIANQLSDMRQSKARQLEKEISTELKDLAMQDAVLKINFSAKEAAVDGIDRIEILISTNPGEGLKPLAKIASGGELSRIMLALKTIIAHIDQVDTLIFDEVDSGVGGQIAQKMAEKLALISRKRQVLCITHLPQIASMGDSHYLISKTSTPDKTYTQIVPLNDSGQQKEIARMLGGVELTDTTLQHAREMLMMAESKKLSL